MPRMVGAGLNWRSPAVLWGGVGGALALSVVFFLVFGGGNLFGGGASPGGGALSVDPASAFLVAGDTLGLVASNHAASGGGGDRMEVRWVSQNPEVARVGPDGVVTGGRAGATTVLAILDSDTSQVSVQVTQGPPARVTLVPSALRLTAGEGGQLEVTVTDALDNLIMDPGLQWTSDAPGVAEVDGTGLVRAQAPGSAVIRAEAGEAWNQITAVVVAPSEDASPTELPEATCPDPVMDELDRLESAMDDPGSSRQELREGAMACWNRGSALTDSERAFAAWLIGLNTVELEGCSQSAILWLDRAVRLEPESEAYKVARAACGGGGR